MVSKRILFVGVSSMKEHAGQYKLYFIADAFGRRGIPVSVLVPDIEENREFFEGRPHVQAHFYRPGNTLADMWRKSSFVRCGVWSAAWVVGVGLRSYLMRRPFCESFPIIKDFDEFPSMIGSFGRVRRAYLRWIERRLIAQADGFTCASEFLDQAVRLQRPEIGRNLLRLPVAISSGEHVVDRELAERLRLSACGRPLVLYVGSVNRFYEDQFDEVIALARTLSRRGSRALLRVVGGGPDLAYFKSKAADAAQNIEFYGHVPRAELASHMEAAGVLVFPFPADAFNLSRCPTKAFNYAAANRPVVTNRTGEVAALFGDAAVYYPERDVEGLADACEKQLGRSDVYDNRIPFRALTWEARAETFSNWLSEQRWLP